MFQWSGRFEDETLRSEFLDVYRKPGVQHLGIACAFGCASAFIFYVLDATGSDQPWIGGAQTLRVALAIGYMILAVLCFAGVPTARRHYATLFTSAAVGFVASVRRRSAGALPSRALATRFPGRRLLLVDDNELNAVLASKLLEAMGFEVVQAENGARAVEAFLEGSFDIVLMDCQMPVMGGCEATQRIRDIEKSSGAKRTPVIALTAYVLAGDREKCLAHGVDDYLGKPYSVKELRPKLERWIPAAP